MYTKHAQSKLFKNDKLFCMCICAQFNLDNFYINIPDDSSICHIRVKKFKLINQPRKGTHILLFQRATCIINTKHPLNPHTY